MKNVALVIAHEGYQPKEYTIPKQLLEQEGYRVLTVSNKAGTATATDGSTAVVDSTLDALSVSDIDGLFFIGGSGALTHLDNNLSYSVLQQAALRPIPVGGICIAPRILAKAGVLITKEATGWNEDGQLPCVYREHGVLFQDQPVVTDGLVITARGPAEATSFAYAIMELV